MQLRILAEAASELEAAAEQLDENGLASAFLDAYQLKLRQIVRFPAGMKFGAGARRHRFVV